MPAENSNGYLLKVGTLGTWMLFMLIGTWSVFPLNGETLPEVLSRRLEISFKMSASIISIVFGVTGVMAFAGMDFLQRKHSTADNKKDGIA